MSQITHVFSGHYKPIETLTKRQSNLSDPFFFGYGSLVNRKTHAYQRTAAAKLVGYRRVWRHTALRDLAFLSIEAAPEHQIDGLIAAVDGNDWAALDLREEGYRRFDLTPAQISHDWPDPVAVQVYQTRTDLDAANDVRHPLLLSYIDVVIQGFHTQFGQDGVARFFETTAGWDTVVLDDRAAPLYPRHQSLSASERGMVDENLAAIGIEIRPTS